jgi:hypothetical protein
MGRVPGRRSPRLRTKRTAVLTRGLFRKKRSTRARSRDGSPATSARRAFSVGVAAVPRAARPRGAPRLSRFARSFAAVVA